MKGVTHRQFREPEIQLYEIIRAERISRDSIGMIRAIESNPIQFIPGWIYLNDTEGGINLIRLIGYETYRATPTFRNAPICIFEACADSARVSNIKLKFVLALYNFGQRYYHILYSCNDPSMLDEKQTLSVKYRVSIKTNLETEIRNLQGEEEGETR